MDEMSSQQLIPDDGPQPRGGGVRKYVITGLIIVLLGTMFFMYRHIVEKNREISALQQENALSIEEQEKLNTYIGEITQTMTEVETRIQEVRSKQVSVTGIVNASASDEAKKTELLNDISVIEDQLKKNKRDIASLQAKMKKSNLQIKSLTAMVANLQKRIADSENTVAELRGALEEKNRMIAEKEGIIRSQEDSLASASKTIKTVSSELEQTSRTLDETKNTAYYVVGTKKELLAKNVLEETGTVFKKVTIARNFDLDAFQRVHIARSNEFPVPCKAKDVQILPARAADTFTLEAAGENACVLKVAKADAFWKMRYLVIVTK